MKKLITMASPEELFQCLTPTCNYIYDPDSGDEEAGIPPGTQFENLPADWRCPFCGAGSERFRGLREPRAKKEAGLDAAHRPSLAK